MLATVLTKTFRDRWKGEVIAAFSLAVMFLFGMAVYRDIDLSVYTDLPEVFRSLMNIPADADVGTLAYGATNTEWGLTHPRPSWKLPRDAGRRPAQPERAHE